VFEIVVSQYQCYPLDAIAKCQSVCPFACDNSRLYWRMRNLFAIAGVLLSVNKYFYLPACQDLKQVALFTIKILSKLLIHRKIDHPKVPKASGIPPPPPASFYTL